MTGPPERPAWRQWIVRLAGAGLVLYVVYFAYSLATGRERMTELCAQITPGMAVDRVLTLAQDNGLGPWRLDAETRLAYLAEARSFGRHACRVEFDHGRVTSASYNYAD
ncbi:MAG: hypothetical protein NT042_16410 [Sulfuritalea sp.]|nr:hypothetical protein [Sulfuritalea sp.]